MATSTIKAMNQSEVLATDATLIRQGKVRTLILNNFSVGTTLSIPSGDRPSEAVGTIALRRDSSTNGSALGFIRVNTDGSVSFFYATNYAVSVSAAQSTNIFAGQITWTV